MICVDNLRMQYGKFEALKGISLSVHPGEIFGFLGVNGAGKTTTLKILAGILKQTSGIVEICGFDIQKDPLHCKRYTGYIPDRPFMYDKLTGREFLEFLVDLYKVSPEKGKENINKLLERFALTEWQHELVEGYTHGMKQRLATCAALVHDPQVLIIDEPMVGLDPHGAQLLKDSLRLYRQQGMTILLSTHSLNVAEELSDRLAILNNGEILTTGTLEEIRSCFGQKDSSLEEVFLGLTDNQYHSSLPGEILPDSRSESLEVL